MHYISTRGHAAAQQFSEILLAGLAPDGGLYLPTHYPQVSGAELDAWRTLSYADLAFEILSRFATRYSRPRTCACWSARPTRRGLLQRAQRRCGRADHAAVHARGAGRRQAGPAGAVQRPDAGLQGHGDAVAGQPVRVHAGAPARGTQHPWRNLRRHRQRGRIRDARQEGHTRFHAVAAPQDEQLPDCADVQPAGREHLQHRRRRRIRRLPGHREGGVATTCRTRRRKKSARSIRSTGRGWWPRSSTTSAATCWPPRRTSRRCRSPCRRGISATSAPAISPA